jgi:hypothetical protein
MFHSWSLDARHAFYIDPEVSTLSDSSDRLSQLDSICTFPSTEYGAYATSLPTDLSDSQFGFWGPEATPPSAASMSDLVHASGNLNSPEIANFWKLYQAYPKHLKAIEKRKNRKAKRRLTSDDQGQ